MEDIVEAGIPPHTSVQAKKIKNWNFYAQQQGQVRKKDVSMLLGEGKIKTQAVGYKMRQHQQKEIKQ